MEKSYIEFTPNTNRIEAFSDAVFAIVMTILVLDLKIPHINESNFSAQIGQELIDILPNFLSFGLSFLVLAIFWVNHHQLFHTIKVADRALLWYNNNLLFWLCCVPFPTAFLGEYPFKMITSISYGLVLFMAGLSFNLIVRHSVKKQLIHESIPPKFLKQAIRRGFIGPIIYFASVIFAPVSVYISLSIFVIVPIIYFIPQKIIFGKDSN